MLLPTITLSALPRTSVQPLAYLYLSQIPYTGLDLGPVGMVVYWIVLVGWSLLLAYAILFGALPAGNRRLRDFGSRVKAALNTHPVHTAIPSVVPASVAPPIKQVVTHTPPVVAPHTTPEAPRGYSAYHGFKSFARNGAVSIDDIVKGLSRHPYIAPKANVEPINEKVEPVYERVEPIYKNVEPIAVETSVGAGAVPAHAPTFTAALVAGDRAAVFASLREHIQGGVAPEHLISQTACLIDDVYRSRVDGSPCDTELARLTARLDTSTLEKLIAALATAIDSSYSTGVTGAKLALTRALTVLGAQR